MRLAIAACVAATTLLFGITSAHAGGPDVAMRLTVVGGTAVVGGGDCDGDQLCVSGMAGDTVQVRIDAYVGPNDAVTFTGPAFVYDPSVAALDVENSSEEPFNFVNGVLMNPIGAPGLDIQELESGFATGWEQQTLTVGGAPGEATFPIGVAAFTLLGGNTTLSMAAAIGQPGGTVVGDGAFADITDMVMLDELRILPEPGTALATFAVLGTLGVIRRRSS